MSQEIKMMLAVFLIVALGFGIWQGLPWMQIMGEWSGDFEKDPRIKNLNLLESVRLSFSKDGKVVFERVTSRQHVERVKDEMGTSSSEGWSRSSWKLNGKFSLKGRRLFLELPGGSRGGAGAFRPFVLQKTYDNRADGRTYARVYADITFSNGALVLKGFADEPEAFLSKEETYHNLLAYPIPADEEATRYARRRVATDDIGDQFPVSRERVARPVRPQAQELTPQYQPYDVKNDPDGLMKTEEQKNAENAIRDLAAAAENYAQGHQGVYPSGTEGLAETSAYAPTGICGKVQDGYLFTCDLSSQGYRITADPAIQATAVTGKRVTITTGEKME